MRHLDPRRGVPQTGQFEKDAIIKGRILTAGMHWNFAGQGPRTQQQADGGGASQHGGSASAGKGTADGTQRL